MTDLIHVTGADLHFYYDHVEYMRCFQCPHQWVIGGYSSRVQNPLTREESTVTEFRVVCGDVCGCNYNGYPKVTYMGGDHHTHSIIYL